MSMSMRYEDTDKLSVFLGNLETDCKKAGMEINRKSGVVVKERVSGQLNRIRSSKNGPNHKHMADDVIMRTVKDSFGDEVVRVRGGTKTGTLWHIVNDGTYRSKAHHFMDKALKEAEPEMLAIIDSELLRVGE